MPVRVEYTGEGLFYLARFRESADRFLGEDQLVVDVDLEDAVTSLDQLDADSEFILDLGRQTGGTWPVVSNHAVLDRYLWQKKLLRAEL